MVRFTAIAIAAACMLAPLAAAAQSTQSAVHTMLLLRSERGRIRLVAQRQVPGRLPRAEARDTAQGWSFEALSDQGEVVWSGNLPDPHIVRGTFLDARGRTTGVGLTSGADQTFAIRVPAGVRRVVIYGVPVRAALAAARSRAASSAVLGRIDL
jgi:hypothetical protein